MRTYSLFVHSNKTKAKTLQKLPATSSIKIVDAWTRIIKIAEVGTVRQLMQNEKPWIFDGQLHNFESWVLGQQVKKCCPHTQEMEFYVVI